MTVVVSDTSPLRALFHLKHLSWLDDLFGQISLPPAVAIELSQPPTGMAAVDVPSVTYLKVRAPNELARVTQLRANLDAGGRRAVSVAPCAFPEGGHAVNPDSLIS